MGDSHKRRHDSDDDEDFLGFEEEGQDLLESRNKRVVRRMANPVGTPGKQTHHEDVDGSIVYDLQTEEEFISLYQNWDSIDKSMFPSPGPLGIPFEYGWRRELVFRATTGVSKEKGDVYYITPQGRKLRTRNEIQANLTAGLTMDNFSLSKVPLYLGPEYEIVRSAKMKTVVKVPSPREISPLLGKRVPKPKAPKGASPTPMTSGFVGAAAAGRSGGAHSKVSTPRAVAATPLSIATKIVFGATAATPVANNNKRMSLQSQQQQQQTKMNPCTIQCRLAQGLVPQLQCVKCLCLYHKECVRERRGASTGQSYVCDGCCPPNTTTTSSMSTTNATSASTAASTTTATVPTNSNEKPSRQSVVTINGCRFIVVPKSKAAAMPSNTGTAPQSSPVVRVTPKTTPALSSGKKPAAATTSSVNGKAKSAQTKSTTTAAQTPSNFFRTTAMGYDVLLNVFQCLTVKELLRASRVCRLFNYTASHPALWRTIRMKNSQVNDWAGFASTLRANGTRHLDLRKMLTGSNVDGLWEAFVQNIATVEQLQGIDLCGRCPPSVVEALFDTSPQLRVLNGLALSNSEEGLSLAQVKCLTELEELRLRPENWMKLRGDLKPLATLANLRHLSLTFFLGLNEEAKHVTALGELRNLETLEIGECTKMVAELAQEVLPKLKKLRRLRLEKGVTEKTLMVQLARMAQLEHVEFINFDVKNEFNESLGKCTNLRKLMIIPTYISQSATTNNLILSALLKLSKTLRTFTWVVTTELLRVTELYRVHGESIPIIKPVPGQLTVVKVEEDEAIPEVEMVPLTSVQEILNTHLPDTFVTILKEDLNSTWRLNIVEQ